MIFFLDAFTDVYLWINLTVFSIIFLSDFELVPSKVDVEKTVKDDFAAEVSNVELIEKFSLHVDVASFRLTSTLWSSPTPWESCTQTKHYPWWTSLKGCKKPQDFQISCVTAKNSKKVLTIDKQINGNLNFLTLYASNHISSLVKPCESFYRLLIVCIHVD